MMTARPAPAFPACILMLCGLCASAAKLPAQQGSGTALMTATTQESGTDQLLQAVSPVDARVVWVSGHGGTWGTTTDGGASWTSGVVPGADELEFRDVEGFDARSALLMAAGPGDRSRIFRTDDAGASWTQLWIMPEADGFLDCMAFFDRSIGIAYGDAVEGDLYLIETRDGGRSWQRVPSDRLPPALEGEGGFAASGDCIRTVGTDTVVVATGNGPRPRLLTSPDRGRSWTVADLPLAAGDAAGATAIGFLPGGFGWVVGGAIGEPLPGPRVAHSTDGGGSWTPVPDPPLEGPLYGADAAPGEAGAVLVATGPGGVVATADRGDNWQVVAPESHWAVAFAPNGVGWAVGPGGRITRFDPHPAPRSPETP